MIHDAFHVHSFRHAEGLGLHFLKYESGSFSKILISMAYYDTY